MTSVVTKCVRYPHLLYSNLSYKLWIIKNLIIWGIWHIYTYSSRPHCVKYLLTNSYSVYNFFSSLFILFQFPVIYSNSCSYSNFYFSWLLVINICDVSGGFWTRNSSEVVTNSIDVWVCLESQQLNNGRYTKMGKSFKLLREWDSWTNWLTHYKLEFF